MNKLFILTGIITLIECKSSFSQKKNWPLIALINNVEFHDSKYNNNQAACGFLLKFKNDTFAVTAKHVLLVAKTDSMNSVYFGNSLKHWIMHPKDKPNEIVLMDRLLNQDKSDSINWITLNRKRFNYSDWLVFSIKENHSNVVPLEIRKTTLKYGEPLFAVGWTYKDEVGEQRIYEYSYSGTYGSHFNMKLVNAPVEGKGLSGSPVIDSNGFLVGIISDGYYDMETRTKFSSPCSVKSLLDIMTGLSIPRKKAADNSAFLKDGR